MSVKKENLRDDSLFLENEAYNLTGERGIRKLNKTIQATSEVRV